MSLNPQCRIQHFNFKFHPITHSSDLSRCICKAFSLSRGSTATPSLLSSANMLMEHLNPVSRLLLSILNRAGPRTEPWGAGLLTGHQPDVTQFATTGLTCVVEVCQFSWNCLSERRQHENYPTTDMLTSLRQTNSYLIYDKLNWFNRMFWFFYYTRHKLLFQNEDIDGPPTQTGVNILDPVLPVKWMNLNCCSFLSIAVFSL